jgi:serine/threonine protein kinase
MDDRTLSDAGQPSPQSGSRPQAAQPQSGPENLYGATISDGGGGSTAVGDAGQPSAAVGGKYRVVHLIGKGGMGTVSLAQDVRLGRWVALKRLSDQFAEDSRLLQRFHTEAKSVGSLTHFHIVQVYAMDEDAEGPYIAMEYVAGPEAGGRADWPAGAPNPPLDLEEFVKAKGALDVAKTVALGTKLCSAVKYAHKRGVIHRDIKPANILLNEDWEPKLADFGLARQVNTQQEGATLAGAQLLTLGYGAPEQEVDASKVDERADIYGMGGTLWYALSGQNPRFFRESEVPEVLRPVLAKALHKDREKRYQTAAEFEEALAALESRAGRGDAKDIAEIEEIAGRVADLRAEALYAPAIDTLRKIVNDDRPRLPRLVEWARRELADLQAQYAAAQKNRDAAVQQAGVLVKANRYAEAVALLEPFPMGIQNAECVDLLGRARAALESIRELRQSIGNQVAANQYDGLRPKAEQLLNLTPNDAQVQKLVQQLAKWEAQQQELGWRAVQQAPTAEKLRSYLRSSPQGVHSQEAKAALAAELRERVLAEPDHLNLRAEYLDLRPDALAEVDQQEASRGVMFAGLAGGAVAGTVAGALGGAIWGPSGALITGVLAGLALAWFMES